MYGSFTRSFTLPNTVDPEQVSAHYEKGVLTVRLAKKAEAKPRLIKVNVEKTLEAKAKRGAIVSFSTSAPGTVTFTVQRPSRKRKGHKRRIKRLRILRHHCFREPSALQPVRALPLACPLLEHLDFEQGGLYTCLRDGVFDDRNHAIGLQLPHRQVHRHRNSEAHVDPCPNLATGLLQHPGTERHDEAGFLGERDEVRRRDQTPGRMRPANQGSAPMISPVSMRALG